MKIISTVQATKKIVAAESGSINTPILNQVSPVCSQLSCDPKGCSPKCSTPRAWKKTTMLPNHESRAAPMAILWLSARWRLVNNTIKKNARSGGSGISQMNVSVVMVNPSSN